MDRLRTASKEDLPMAMNSSIERLAARLGIGSGSRKIGRTTLLRLSIYYAVVFLIVGALIVVTDNMDALHMAAAAARRKAAANPDAFLAGTPESWTMLKHGILGPLFRALPPLGTGAAAVITAFLLAVPVAFTYVRTRSSLQYDQSLVQTVIMLPVVVTAILIVVENSLALAFSLAGIVAAVRFRNNLKDSRDAVYIFAAVGIGFASGVGALAITAFLSTFFCVMELLLWKLDLASDHEHTFGLLCTPAGAARTKRIGIPALPTVAGAAAAAATDAAAAIPSADTALLALGGAKPDVREGDANGGKRPPQRLLVYVTDPEKARRIADAVLDDMTKEYKLTKSTNGGNDQYVLEYRVRTRKKSPGEAIIDRLHAVGMPYVIAAELLPDTPQKS
jgi:hypothetical protein